jgi:hypothetical protein
MSETPEQDQKMRDDQQNTARQCMVDPQDIPPHLNVGEHNICVTLPSLQHTVDASTFQRQSMLDNNWSDTHSYEQYGMFDTLFQPVSQQQPDSNMQDWDFRAVKTEYPPYHQVLEETRPVLHDGPWTMDVDNTAKEISSPISSNPIAGLRFANHAQAQQAFSQRYIQNDWHPPINDESMPRGQVDREGYIAQLKAAFIDISQCQDAGTAKIFGRPWYNIPRDSTTRTSECLETVCWKLLNIAENLHHFGPRSLRIFDENKFKTAYKFRHHTFSYRIQALCKVLRASKARCSKLLDFDDLGNLVAAPEQILSSSESNKHDNRRRQEFLVEGRAQAKNNGYHDTINSEPAYEDEMH